jgi:sugar (pentulose or hexulose) kinase
MGDSMSYFLGVDMGTSSIKATLLNDRGEILLTERLPVELICPGEGMYEVDAVKTWWNGFVAICRNQLSAPLNLMEK